MKETIREREQFKYSLPWIVEGLFLDMLDGSGDPDKVFNLMDTLVFEGLMNPQDRDYYKSQYYEVNGHDSRISF